MVFAAVMISTLRITWNFFWCPRIWPHSRGCWCGEQLPDDVNGCLASWVGAADIAQRLLPLVTCCITKTCLYNFDPLKLHFYIVKLGFTWVYIIFLITAQNHKLWVLVRTASSTNNLCFDQKYEKISEFLSENFQFLVVKFSDIWIGLFS